MAKPVNKQQFGEWCLRKLGAPVINIEVASEQLDDRIDEALDVYTEKHFDATIEEWVAYTVTQQDVDNGYIQLPSDILAVIELLPTAELFAHAGMFSFQYQVAMQQLSPWQSFSNLDYFMTMTSFQETLDMTSVTPTFKFQRHGNKLKINYQFVEGYQLAVKIQRILDPELYTEVWNDKWLKQYATALIKRQWGENLSKHGGVSLLGGVTLNGEAIYQQAESDIEKLLEELQSTYMEPTDMIFG